VTSPAIPPFEEAFHEFREFLRSQGHAETVLWAFREDLYFPDRATCLVRDPLPSENERLVQRVFDQGRAAGLVELKAIAVSRDITIATVWFPREPEEEVQGWSTGMKLSVVEPPVRPRFIRGGMRWWLLTLGTGYRRYQRQDTFIATRAWAEG
jgi:hypothetical protein